MHSALHSGDTVTTDGDTQLKVILGKKEAALLIKKGSRLSISQTPEKSWTIQLDQGMLLSAVKPHPFSPKSHFRVRTRSASIGVRGTVFFVKSEPGKDDYLC